MGDGSIRSIENVQLGDQVASFDHFGDLVGRKVLHLFVHDNKSIVSLNGLNATPEHVFFKGDGSFQPIGCFKKGDNLVRTNGEQIPFPGISPVDGFRENMGWAGADDGLLAYDHDQDGVIDKLNEISSRSAKDKAKNPSSSFIRLNTSVITQI